MNIIIHVAATFALSCALLSCKPNSNEEASGNISKHDSSGLVIGNPFEYGISYVLLFPVGSNYSPSIFKNPELAREWYVTNSKVGVGFTSNTVSNYYDSNANSEYVNTDEKYFDIRNLLFYDKRTGKSHPLTRDTLHILSFAIHYDFNRPQIFYRVVKKDINNDSMYNSKDPIVLYTSSLQGDSLVQMSPDDEQFAEYFYYKETQTILIKTNLNPDNDTSFATMVETNFREVHLSKPSMGREIFSKGMLDSLRVD